MASAWNLWVWLECIGMVSGCCCKEVYRYPPTPFILALFWQQHYMYHRVGRLYK